MLLSAAATLIRILFAFLDLTFLTGNTGGRREILDGALAVIGLPGVTALSYLLLALAVLFTLVAMLSYFLMLQKRVIGLFIMIGLDLVGLLLWQFDVVVMYFTAARWVVLGLPWLLTWVDLKRRGVFLGP